METAPAYRDCSPTYGDYPLPTVSAPSTYRDCPLPTETAPLPTETLPYLQRLPPAYGDRSYSSQLNLPLCASVSNTPHLLVYLYE